MEILKSSHEGGGKPQRGEARFVWPGGRGWGWCWVETSCK